MKQVLGTGVRIANYLVPQGGSQKSKVKSIIEQGLYLFEMGGLFTPRCTRCQKQGRQHQMDGFPGIKRLLSRWIGDTIVIAAPSIPPLILKTKFSGGRGRE